MPLRLTPSQRAALHALTHCALDTIRKYPTVSEASRLRIEDGCRTLGIAVPPSPAKPDQAA